MQQSLSLPLTAADLLLEVDQLAQRGAGEVLDVAEVQQEALVAFVLDQAVELVAHFLDLLLGHDLGIDEADDRHPINIFQAEMTARALRHRETPVEDGNRTEPRQLTSVQAGPARGPHRRRPDMHGRTHRGENPTLTPHLPESAGNQESTEKTCSGNQFGRGAVTRGRLLRTCRARPAPRCKSRRPCRGPSA